MHACVVCVRSVCAREQKTGNAIRALGRMATLSAASRRVGSGTGGGGGGAGAPGGGGGTGLQQFKMASVSEEESAGESSAEQQHRADEPPAQVPVARKHSGGERGAKGRRSCDARSDSGFSDCSSLVSLTASVRSHGDHKPTAIAEETSPPAARPPAAAACATAPPPTRRRTAETHTALVLPAGTGGLCEANRLIFDGGAARRDNGAGNVRRKEPIRIQTGDNFKKAIAFWKQ